MSPAFRLVVACCRWPPTDARREAIAAAAKEVRDWDEVVATAERHRVEPLVMHGLGTAAVAVPSALARSVETYRGLALRDLSETLKIARAFGAAGIEHRFLKGLPLGVVAYGNMLLKRSWDIDVLVGSGDAVAAAACLTDLGYNAMMPPRPLDAEEFARWAPVSKEAEFRNGGGTTVELHWGISDHPHLLPNASLRSPARRVALLGDSSVATLPDAENLAYLAVHGTAHAWFRLKWIADFQAFLQSLAPSRRDAVVTQARGLGVGRAMDVALGLSQSLFGEVQEDFADPRLLSWSLRALESDESGANRYAARSRMRLATGITYRAHEFLRRLRGTEDRVFFPLPRSWHFLYPWLRVPFWAFRRLSSYRRD